MRGCRRTCGVVVLSLNGGEGGRVFSLWHSGGVAGIVQLGLVVVSLAIRRLVTIGRFLVACCSWARDVLDFVISEIDCYVFYD